MADTSVLPLTGARAIEALRPGDLVICRDETRQMSVVKPVVRLIRNHHQKILSLTLRGSSRDELLADLPAKIEEITCDRIQTATGSGYGLQNALSQPVFRRKRTGNQSHLTTGICIKSVT
ncbi:Hint domain-containing protein [Acetobacter thailandicus]|uniref:Hint domain-containing protein n=1 Tax=Acetobacter thailandicus TaxID=1502842 RepID=A0ABT3QG52_9PROT|nr:Hint domain-containing protein [Acetobacter thailandicus]MCX2564265.1 Hint domain-containing protein [Acetobacter thailandicus]